MPNTLNYQRVIVKIGTTMLTHPNGKLNLNRIERLSWVLSDLRNRGMDVVLVSSGAIAVGTDRLGLAERPRDIQGKQAASAVGQAILMHIYETFFMKYNQIVAQILLTKDVFEDQARKNNARNTFSALLSQGIIPIINENDTVATDEIEFSDNDTLSAYVAMLIESDALIILSDIDGLYDSNPRTNKNAKRLDYVPIITSVIEEMAGEAGSSLGTGGMISKITAAKMVGEVGIDTIIASGEDPTILFDILEDKAVCTLFKANEGVKLNV